MNETEIQSHSSGWMLHVKLSFGIACAGMAAGIFFMQGDLMLKGYFAMAGLFLVSATFTLAKTLRDQHESQRLYNRISEAKTSKILNEFAD